MDGLIVKQNWLDKILDGSKDWEVRGRQTLKRGTVKLIQSASGLVVGQVDIITCRPLTKAMYDLNIHHHRIDRPYDALPYCQPYRWELANAMRYEKPIKYAHPRGAVIWVKDVEKREVKEI